MRTAFMVRTRIGEIHLISMTKRLLLQVFFPIHFIVGNHQTKQTNKRNCGYPYCPTLYMITKRSAYHCTYKETQQHKKVFF